ncbi:MAG: hypothetical protein AB9915_01700 [Candidatus Dojkabacteria bacterium]
MFIEEENIYIQPSLSATDDKKEEKYPYSFAVAYAKCLGKMLLEHTPQSLDTSEWMVTLLNSLEWFSQNERKGNLPELIYKDYIVNNKEYLALEALALLIQANPSSTIKLASANQENGLLELLSPLFGNYIEHLGKVKKTLEETEPGKRKSLPLVITSFEKYLKGKPHSEDLDIILSDLIIFFAKDLNIL